MTVFRHLNKNNQRRANMRRFFFVGTAILFAAFLGACTSTHSPQTETPAIPVNERLLARYFSFGGRISVRVNDRVDSGQIRWQRRPDEERIGLYSPLGSQVAELVSDTRTGAVTLQQGKEKLTAASIAELTQSLLGVPLDLNRLAEWVQGYGLRENEIADATLGNGDVWQVRAERYQSSGNYQFASRLVATRGDTVLRLVIDDWAPQ